jgi:sulfotransferase
MKKIYYMSGLPRSGSTLISSILNQNKNIYASSNSSIVPLAATVESSIIMSESYNAYPRPKVVKKTVAGVIENFYSDRKEEYIIDKSRLVTIPEHFRCVQRNFDYKPKVIIPVRNVTDVLASFLKLVYRTPSDQENFIDKDIATLNDINLYLSKDDTRVEHLMKPKGMIDNQLYGIAFMLQPEFRKYAHFIEYDNLVSDTRGEIEKLYSFLEIEPFEHDYNNIKNVTPENDKVYGVVNMHTVRKTISPSTTDAKAILSEYAYNKYSNLEFWREALGY